MTGGLIIAPVVLPRAGAMPGAAVGTVVGPRREERRVLPLASMPPLPVTPRTRWAYGLGSVDDRGRVSDLTTPRALGWVPRTGLDFQIIDGLIVVHRRSESGFVVTGRGHVRLPAPTRRWCGLTAGDRLLLAADLERDRLVLHPPAALNRMLDRVNLGLSEAGPQ